MRVPVLDDVVDVGIDVVSASAAPSVAAAGRVGCHGEIVAFGMAGAIAAKEAATKAIGGRPPGSSLLDVHIALDLDAGAGPPDDVAVAVMLGDLGVEPATARRWRFGVAPHLPAAVGSAGGCPSGSGVIGETAAGHVVALCLGWPGAVA